MLKLSRITTWGAALVGAAALLGGSQQILRLKVVTRRLIRMVEPG